jgi:hypothetical protein
MTNEKLLMAAHAIFNSLGYLPLDVAADLMLAGFIVDELEARWEREKNI